MDIQHFYVFDDDQYRKQTVTNISGNNRTKKPFPVNW